MENLQIVFTTEEILKNSAFVDVRGYKIKDVKIYVLDCYYNYKLTFEEIYSKLLLYTIKKGTLENPHKKLLNIRNVYKETLNIMDRLVLEQKKEFKYIIKVDDMKDLLVDWHYELNVTLLRDNDSYKLLDNSVDDIIIKVIL